MGCCSSKSNDSKTPSRCFLCCCCCCGSNPKETKSGAATKSQQLPEPRSHVHTYDFTSSVRKSAIGPTGNTFMSFAANKEHPSDLDRNVAINPPGSPVQYVRLNGAEEVATAMRRLSSVKQHKTLDFTEEATRM